jgi:retron-type reverse transcriptase
MGWLSAIRGGIASQTRFSPAQVSHVIVALRRVKKNKDSPGIDGMTVEALRDHLRETWPVLR